MPNDSIDIYLDAIKRMEPDTWKPWFAWYPVRLLTLEWAWLRWIDYRPAESGVWSYGGWDYANPVRR